jgi:Spy/CpxP family protein refolding chaperone
MSTVKGDVRSSVRCRWGAALALAVAALVAMSSPALTAETSADPMSGHKNIGAAPAGNLRSPYAALRGTAATGLLPEEVEGLVGGKGMALALAAEVNGYPGPRHVLEAAEASQLSLRPDQLSAIQQLNDRMLQEAQAKGQEILQAEAHLAQRFREGHIDEPSLRESLEHIGRLRAELRLVHLRTHLTTRELLTAEQIAQYNIVRGYEVSSGGHHPRNR